MRKIGGVEYINDNGSVYYLEYPLITNIYKNSIPHQLGKPMLALMQLLICREVYRQGWKPDWEDISSNKYCIERFKNSIKKVLYNSTHRILSFQSEEIQNLFLENFRNLIEEAKELI